MSHSTQWLSSDHVNWFAEMAAQKHIPSLTDLDLQHWEHFSLHHIKRFTPAHLFAMLRSAQQQSRLALEPFPAQTSTHEQLLNEIIPYLTVFSPTYSEQLNNEEMKPYRLHTHRYMRQKQIQVFDPGTLRVPLDGHTASFDQRTRDNFITQWGKHSVERPDPDIQTNIVAYLAAQKYLDYRSTPLYQFPIDVKPHRFAFHLSALRRVRLSARVNEEYIQTVGVSFFISDSKAQLQPSKVQSTYRARFNERDMKFNIAQLPNHYLRVRMVGIRPSVTHKTGLGVDLVERTAPPQPTPIQVHYTLPSDIPLVKEINEQWMVFPFAVPNHPEVPFDLPKYAVFWVSPRAPPPPQPKPKDPECNGYTNVDKVCQIIPEQHPHTEWKSKLLKLKSRNKCVPIVDPIKLPRFVTDELFQHRTLKFEMAYKTQPHDNRPKEPYQDPPFRACALIEIVRVMSLDEMIKKVQDRPPLDLPRPSAPNTSPVSGSGTIPSPPPIACPGCGKTSNLSRCSQCKEVYYCSSICQRKDWEQHRHFCRQRSFEKNQEAQRKAQMQIHQESGIELGDSRHIISLECPLSGVRCTIPVRGLSCAHKRCFDLRAWIEQSMLPNTKANMCPICEEPLLLDDLRIAQRVKIALETIDPRVLEVEIGENDLYIPRYRAHVLAKGRALDDDDGSGSDGENPFEKKTDIKRQNVGQNTTTAAANQLVQLQPPKDNVIDLIELD